MKANEYVKQNGWVMARKAVAECTYGYGIDLTELKRLVESHELIEKDFDSVEIAEYEYMISGCYSDPYWIRIKQAIADVESCYD